MDILPILSNFSSSSYFTVTRVENSLVYYSNPLSRKNCETAVEIHKIRVENRKCCMRDIQPGDRIQDIKNSSMFLLETWPARIVFVDAQNVMVQTLSKTSSQIFQVPRRMLESSDELVYKSKNVSVKLRSGKVKMMVFESGKTFYLSDFDNLCNSVDCDTLHLIQKDAKSMLNIVSQEEGLKTGRSAKCVLGAWFKLGHEDPELKLKDCVKAYVLTPKGSKRASVLNMDSPSEPAPYKPFDESDFTRTQFDISLLKRIYNDSKGFLDTLSCAFSSFRYFPYSNNSLYKLVGIGYLEHVILYPTSTFNLASFISKVRPLPARSDPFSRSRSILLTYLLKLSDKLKSGQKLNLHKLFQDETFINAMITYLKYITAQRMASQNLPKDKCEVQTLPTFYPNKDTYKYLSQALNIRTVFYNIEICQISDFGLPSSDIVLYLTQRCNQKTEKRNYELLYSKYQDNPGIDRQELGCSMCGKVPHETLFDNIFHWVCLDCKAVMMLKGLNECKNCGYWFNEYQVKGISSRMYACSECRDILKFEELQGNGEINRLVCKTCFTDKKLQAITEDFEKCISECEEKSEPESLSRESSTSIESSNPVSEDTPKPKVITCQTCSGNTSKITLKCLHVFCRVCIIRHFNAALSTGKFPVACPECESVLSKHDIRSFCEKSVAESYIERYTQFKIPCFSCKELRNIKSLVKLGCGHEFDNDCLESYFKDVIIKNQGLIRCPAGCPEEVDMEIIELNLSPLYFHKYQKLAAEERKRIEAGKKCMLVRCGESSEEENYVKFSCNHSICRGCAVLELIGQMKKKMGWLRCPVCEEALFQAEYEELIDAKLLKRYRETVQGMVF
jgi:hypothetical protein